MTVRAANIDDVEQIVRLGLKCVEQDAKDRANEDHIREAIQSFIDSDLFGVFVACDGDRIKSSVAAMLSPMFWNRSIVLGMVILWWSIDPHYARGCIKAAESWCHMNGANHMFVGSRAVPGNERIGSLYEAMGYIECEKSYRKEIYHGA